MMRWLLALLLLINLGLFLWGQFMIAPQKSSPQKTVRLPGTKEIVLLREMENRKPSVYELDLEETEKTEADDAPLPDADQTLAPDMVQVQKAGEVESPVNLPGSVPEEPETAAVAVAEPVCGRVGPFTDSGAAEGFQKQSTSAGISTELEQTTDLVKKGYWVLIPALPSRQEAQQLVEKLKAAGVKDLWLFTRGPKKNAISLGMYVGINNATAHSNNINRKGFDSKVSPKMSEQTNYWLAYSALEEQALDDWLARLPAELKNEKKACE